MWPDLLVEVFQTAIVELDRYVKEVLHFERRRQNGKMIILKGGKLRECCLGDALRRQRERRDKSSRRLFECVPVSDAVCHLHCPDAEFRQIGEAKGRRQ